MRLDDLFEVLQYGEVSNTNLVDVDTGEIALNKYPRLITFINRGLTALYSSFLLKEDIVTVQQLDGRTTYVLHSKHAQSNTTSTEIKFILDTVAKPFSDDLLKIESISDELGDPIPLNDLDTEDSFFLPEYNKVQVTNVNPNMAFHVTYRANHTKIAPNTTDLTTIDVVLPDSFIDALVHYVSSKAYGSVNTSDGREAAGVHYGYYLKSIADIKANALGPNGYNITNNKAGVNGWV